jgi:hypothetical protein
MVRPINLDYTGKKTIVYLGRSLRIFKSNFSSYEFLPYYPTPICYNGNCIGRLCKKGDKGGVYLSRITPVTELLLRGFHLEVW